MTDSQGVPLSTRIRNKLVVTMPAEAGPDTFEAVQSLTLTSIQQRHTSAVIFDCAAVSFMDVEEFEQLCRAAAMVQALGSTPYLAGLRADTVMFLVQADAATCRIRAFPGVDEALNHLEAGDVHARTS